MSTTTGTSTTLAVPSHCEFLLDEQHHSDDISADWCFSALLPYLLNANFVMDEDGLSHISEKEQGI